MQKQPRAMDAPGRLKRSTRSPHRSFVNGSAASFMRPIYPAAERTTAGSPIPPGLRECEALSRKLPEVSGLDRPSPLASVGDGLGVAHGPSLFPQLEDPCLGRPRPP